VSPRGRPRRLEHVRRLVETLSLQPDAAKLVVSSLVPIEWAQNQAAVVVEVERMARNVDNVGSLMWSSAHFGHSNRISQTSRWRGSSAG
jgi:hypothetical protein